MPAGRKSKYDEPMDPAVYLRLRKGMSDEIRKIAKREDRTYVSAIRRILQVGLEHYPHDPLG